MFENAEGVIVVDYEDANRSVYGEKGFICHFCGGRASFDDLDFMFSGCQDEFWICDHCKVAFDVKVRYGKIFSVRERLIE